MKPHKYWSIAKFSKQQKYWFKSRFIKLLVNQLKLLQFKPSLTLLLFFPPHEILAVTERKEGTQAFAKGPWMCYFSLLRRNTTGLMQGLHKSCVQEKKSWTKHSPKTFTIAESKAGEPVTPHSTSRAVWGNPARAQVQGKRQTHS